MWAIMLQWTGQQVDAGRGGGGGAPVCLADSWAGNVDIGSVLYAVIRSGR